jgi:hypothetical protein
MNATSMPSRHVVAVQKNTKRRRRRLRVSISDSDSDSDFDSDYDSSSESDYGGVEANYIQSDPVFKLNATPAGANPTRGCGVRH